MKTPTEYARMAEAALDESALIRTHGENPGAWNQAAQVYATLAVAAAGVTEPEPLTWTLEEAAEQLQLTPRLTSELIARGAIPALRFGRGRVRVSRAALRNYVEGIAS